MAIPAQTNDLAEASRFLIAALRLLDRADAPGEIGAYVDLAHARLHETMCRNARADVLLFPRHDLPRR